MLLCNGHALPLSSDFNFIMMHCEIFLRPRASSPHPTTHPIPNSWPSHQDAQLSPLGKSSVPLFIVVSRGRCVAISQNFLASFAASLAASRQKYFIMRWAEKRVSVCALGCGDMERRLVGKGTGGRCGHWGEEQVWSRHFVLNDFFSFFL